MSLVSAALGSGKPVRNPALVIAELEHDVKQALTNLGDLLEEAYQMHSLDAVDSLNALMAKLNTTGAEMSERLQCLHDQNRYAKGASEHGAAAEKYEADAQKIDDYLSSMEIVVNTMRAFDSFNQYHYKTSPYLLAKAVAEAENCLNKLQYMCDGECKDPFELVENVRGDRMPLFDQRVIPALHAHLCWTKDSLSAHLFDWWRMAIRVTKVDLPDASDQLVGGVSVAQCHELVARFGNEQCTVVNEHLNALSTIGELNHLVKSLSRQLTEHLLKVIITDRRFSVNVRSLGDGDLAENLIESCEDVGSAIGIVCSEESLSEKGECSTVSDCRDRIWELSKFMDALQDVLGFVNVENGDSDAVTLIKLIGDNSGPAIMKLICEDLLKPSVPDYDDSDKKSGNLFDQMVQDAHNLEVRMKEIHLLSESDAQLNKFMEQVESLRIDKRCKKLLAEARRLILSEQHTPVEVGSDVPTSMEDICAPPTNAETSGSDKILQSLADANIPPVMRFPKCKVSASIVELMELISTTMEEALRLAAKADQSDLHPPLLHCSARLATTCRNMLELYVDLTAADMQATGARPSVPFVTAMMYNGAHYLAHFVAVSVIDCVPRLHALAADTMRRQLISGKKDIDSMLTSTDMFTGLASAKKHAQCGSALRACVQLLTQAKQVWLPLLTRPVLLRALSQLCTHVMNRVFDLVTQPDDISAADAEIVADFCHNLKRDVKAFLTIDCESHVERLCTKSFYRLNELAVCLLGSLLELSERWCGGAGPLAQYLTPDEARHLCRALFQNTDRRANVLAGIK